MSVFDDVACAKKGVQDENAQFSMAGELPKCVNALHADSLPNPIMKL
jgi:hypothetical protein